LPEDSAAAVLAAARGFVDTNQAGELPDAVVAALDALYRRDALAEGQGAWDEAKLDAFLGWLRQQKDLYSGLILAVHPRDHVAKVFAVLETLRGKFPKAVSEWPHLAIAFAVVWDDGRAPQATRDAVIWGAHQQNAFEPETMERGFQFLIDTKSRLTFRPDQLRWPTRKKPSTSCRWRRARSASTATASGSSAAPPSPTPCFGACPRSGMGAPRPLTSRSWPKPLHSARRVG
jgi:hypothetical protein